MASARPAFKSAAQVRLGNLSSLAFGATLIGHALQPLLRASLSTSAPRFLATPVGEANSTSGPPKNLKTFSIYRWVSSPLVSRDIGEGESEKLTFQPSSPLTEP